MRLRSPVSGVPFPKSVSPEQSLNIKVPFFVHGKRLRRSHVPQKPCGRGAISRVGATRAILEQKCTVICSWNAVKQKPCASEALWTGCYFKSRCHPSILEQKCTVICSWKAVTQKPCASEALWTGYHFKNRNTGTKYRHFVFHRISLTGQGKRL